MGEKQPKKAPLKRIKHLKLLRNIKPYDNLFKTEQINPRNKDSRQWILPKRTLVFVLFNFIVTIRKLPRIEASMNYLYEISRLNQTLVALKS